MPAPVNGWSSLDSIADAEDQSAIIMDNIFPRSDSVEVRHGLTTQSTGLSGGCYSLMAYNGAGGTKKLFGSTASAIYDLTSGGAVGAAAVSGLSNGKISREMFTAGSGNQYLVICNGVDGVRTFDGTTWVDQTASITGTSTAVNRFTSVCGHKTRLWFVENNSTNLWYLPVTAINGAAAKYPLGSFLKLGGRITAIATWSSSQGYALDDMLVAITTQGEVLVFAGTDPSSANTWALKMRFVLAPPMSDKCFLPIGAELLVITEAGVLPISQVVEVDPSTLSTKAISRQIRRAYTDAVKISRGVFGWCASTLPQENMGVLNVPASGSTVAQQFVINTMTGKWCRFTGWAMNCFEYFDGKLYGGHISNGKVYRCNEGANDDGTSIPAVLIPAYTDFGVKGLQKMVNAVQPTVYGDIDPLPAVGIAADYRTPTLGSVVAASSSGWFQWDVTPWDGPAVWRGTDFYKQWDGAGNYGRVLSVAWAANVDGGSSVDSWIYRIIKFDFIFETGSFV